MAERPILFSGPMVRAILDGRKTQTRRVVKPQPPSTYTRHCWHDAPVYGWTFEPEPAEIWHTVRCPYGTVGDRLWVREAIDASEELDDPVYAADRKPFDPWRLMQSAGIGEWRCRAGVLSPSHMPRWASRLTLEITGVRVERLQDISEEDAIAEGCPGGSEQGYFCPDHPYSRPSHWYADLWESINGKGSWAANPWVWVREFNRAEVSRG